MCRDPSRKAHPLKAMGGNGPAGPRSGYSVMKRLDYSIPTWSKQRTKKKTKHKWTIYRGKWVIPNIDVKSPMAGELIHQVSKIT